MELPHVEGFGLVFLEAAACGTPALGGNSGGIPDAVLDEQTGWLVDPKNPRAVPDKIQTLFQKPETIENMGLRAQQHTLNHRRWDQVSQAIAQLMFESP